MNKLISLFPEQLSEALKIGSSFTFSKPETIFQNVIISGLGGSGIGGDIVNNYATKNLKVPIIVNKSYDLPAFATTHSLVIICSYSGNTEETISAFKQAIECKAFIVCITSGGIIKKMAKEHNIPCLSMPLGRPPRTCLGYSIINILFALYHCGIMDNVFIEKIQKAALLLKEQQEQMMLEAKNIAQKITDKLPVIYAANHMEGVSARWRQQINENSKMPGWNNVIPEMNHNELVGWRDKNEHFAVFFLHSDSDHAKVTIRMGINKKIISRCTTNTFDIYARGESYWEQAFSLIHIGDWLSYYLAKERKLDADEVKVIDYLKNKLANHP